MNRGSKHLLFEKYEHNEITFFIVFGILMAIGFPVIVGGFIFKGFEESFVAGKPVAFGTILLNFIIYLFFFLVGILGLPALKLREMENVKPGENVAKQKTPNPMAVAIIHDPIQDGALWNLGKSLGFKDEKNPMRFSKSMLRLFIISILFFGLICIFKTFTSIPNLTFQITPSMSVFFSAEPASFSETMMIIFVLSLLLGLNAYLVSKFKLPTFVYWLITLLIICPALGFGWSLMHSIVYGNSEVDLATTFIFGYAGITLTVLLGSFIPFYTWHFLNNIFARLKELSLVKEDLLLVFGAVWIFLFISYIAIEIWLYTIRKKKRIT
jgi:MFS family permease